jgi:glycosyltransferase involved in cell wall biosynthesis
MASGTPVVATPNGGAEEVLDAGGSGRIVHENALGNELVALLTDSEARATLAAAGLARAKRYDIARIAEEYEALYEMVTRLRNRTPKTSVPTS